MSQASKLESALARRLARGGDLIAEIASLKDYPIRTAADAQAICLALTRLIELPPETPDLPIPTRTPLDWLAGLFQQVETQEAFEVLQEYGLPPLLLLYDERSDRVDLLFLLKLFALYRDERGVRRVIDGVKQGLQSDGRLWSVVFRQFDVEHPYCQKLVDALRDPLPRGFIAVAFLDWCNAMCLAEKVEKHPFDSPGGFAMLKNFLADPHPVRASFAQSAAASLPFLSTTLRNDLMVLALDHNAAEVQMEGAWASAKLGSSGGITILSRLCLDPVHGKQAIQYLKELELEEAIPKEAQNGNYLAQAELTAWLAHPEEFGRPPDEIALLDTRELYWPPTRDRRQLWLFRYRYVIDDSNDPVRPDHEPYEIGVGMVGSITFSLLGETNPGMSPEDLYALHCCFEMEYKGDGKTPKERSIRAGRYLLRQHQAGF